MTRSSRHESAGIGCGRRSLLALPILMLSLAYGGCRQAAETPSSPPPWDDLQRRGGFTDEQVALARRAAWNAPDLYSWLKTFYRIDYPHFRAALDLRREHPTDLQMLYLRGPGVRRGAVLKQASPYDLMPTMAWLLELPISSRLPGRILKEAFDESFVRSKPVYKVARYGPRPTGPLLPSPADEEMLRSLKNLGYIK